MKLEKYFDYNATTPVDQRVVESMLPCFTENFANPSSFYRSAAQAREAVESSRALVAAQIGADPEEIIFTSGGTEADNLAVIGTALKSGEKGRHIIASPLEHPAVLNSLLYLEKRGFEISFLPVDSKGIIDPDDLKKMIKPDTILVAVMHANNEIGTIQPLEELVRIARGQGVRFFSDAVQSLGKTDMDVKRLGVDLLSISGHKIYGPKGIGALYRKRGCGLIPILHGGGHENRLRSGTENVAGIVGLARAVELISTEKDELESLIRPLRDRLYRGLLEVMEDVRVNGDPENGLFNTLNLSFRHIEGESILAFLDHEGFALSSGSACSSKSLDPSHVLLAIGLEHEAAHGSLRFSLGKYNTAAGVDLLLDALPPVVKRLRSMSPFGR